jgi:hypothetical protein
MHIAYIFRIEDQDKQETGLNRAASREPSEQTDLLAAIFMLVSILTCSSTL